MNQLTRIAALPGSGAGCASALRVEKVEKAATTIDAWCACLQIGILYSPVLDPAPRKSRPCPVKFEDPKESGPTPADMAAHPAWGRPTETPPETCLATDFCDPSKSLSEAPGFVTIGMSREYFEQVFRPAARKQKIGGEVTMVGPILSVRLDKRDFDAFDAANPEGSL